MNPDREELISSALAGVLGAGVFALFYIAIGNKAVIAGAIPALYGLSPSLAAGVLIHLLHGAVLGVAYAFIVGGTGYGHHLDDVKKATGWGLFYGAAAALVLAASLMPMWLSSVGFPNAPAVPNVSPAGMAGHLIYGASLGGSYPLIRNQLE